MINEVVLVGKISKISKELDCKKELLIDVERPFKEGAGRVSDTFICQLWTSIFKKVLSVCNIGDLLAIKGRLIKDEDDRYLIVAENVVMLNKSEKNIFNRM